MSAALRIVTFETLVLSVSDHEALRHAIEA